MPFRLALSGLNAASQDLTVTANNIANVGTAGFKESRTEFAEMFAVSPQGVASTAVPSNVNDDPPILSKFLQRPVKFLNQRGASPPGNPDVRAATTARATTVLAPTMPITTSR